MRHDKHNRNREALPGIGEALAVVAARCAHDAFHLGPVALETIYVIDSASHPEGADGSVVLVLTMTSTPKRCWRRGQTYCGVGGMTAFTTAVARSRWSKLNMESPIHWA